MTPKQKAEAEAKRLGVELDFRRTGHHLNIEAVAPVGFCFEPSLHGLVEHCYHGKGDSAYIYGEIAERLASYPSLEECDPDCDCRDDE